MASGLRLLMTGQNSDIWVYEIARGTLSRLTFAPGVDATPIWTPDGRHVTFNGIRTGPMEILQTSFDGSGGEERLIEGRRVEYAGTVLAPEREMACVRSGRGHLRAVNDRMTANRSPSSRHRLSRSSRRSRPMGAGSPISRTRAAGSRSTCSRFRGPEASGRFPPTAALRPKWSRNGRELFFRAGDRMMAAPIEPGPTFASGTARVLFEGQYAPRYDVTRRRPLPHGSRRAARRTRRTCASC